MEIKKNILVCPLDWGLGHATRMVPVIEMFVRKGANVILAADKRPLAFLRQRFPELVFVSFPGFVPVYPEKGSMALAMLKDFPKMRKSAEKSHALLQELIEEKKIDVVISDNRYELHSCKLYSVFVTHQLHIQTVGVQKPAGPLIRLMANSYIREYDELWIPDVAGEANLSGVLSHSGKPPIGNTHFIGPLSRFEGLQPEPVEGELDLLVLVSGPEPQRSFFEKMLTGQALKTNLKTVILQGKPELSGMEKKENVKIIPHLPDAELAALIAATKLVVSRPGYSTLMDLAVFGKKAVFVPTPGQTEQEYLAERLFKKGMAFSMKQSRFKLEEAIREAKNFSGLIKTTAGGKLEERVGKLLQ